MTDLLLHPKTSQQISGLLLNTPHAVLILGPNGSGKNALVMHYASEVLNAKNISDHPYIRQINAAEGEGIAHVREIRAFLNLKTTGKNEIRRAVILENTDKLGAEAQNALLKIIEEPPVDTVILLTASSAGNLLDTIRSRVSVINILPLDESTALSYSDDKQARSAYALSGGYPGLFKAILESDGEHEVKQAVDNAKRFLAMTIYERLCQIDALSKDKQELVKLLDGLELCLHAATKAAKSSNIASISKKLEYIDKAQDRLNKNVNAKLLLTSLAINL